MSPFHNHQSNCRGGSAGSSTPACCSSASISPPICVAAVTSAPAWTSCKTAHATVAERAAVTAITYAKWRLIISSSVSSAHRSSMPHSPNAGLSTRSRRLRGTTSRSGHRLGRAQRRSITDEADLGQGISGTTGTTGTEGQTDRGTDGQSILDRINKIDEMTVSRPQTLRCLPELGASWDRTSDTRSTVPVSIGHACRSDMRSPPGLANALAIAYHFRIVAGDAPHRRSDSSPGVFSPQRGSGR